jgi:hypothetical protein
MTGLRLSYEWESGDGVAAPELNATWVRLEIWVGSECVTQVEDAASHSARRSIYCSLYPIAEWISYNWWLLKAHARPAGAFVPRRERPTHLPTWLKSHNLREAGDGFLWPDLSIIPEGEWTRLAWSRDPKGIGESPIRYIAQGSATCESNSVQLALAEVVESVLARLDEHAIRDTPLAGEWQAITATDEEEQEFCVAAARLGLDPYSIDPEIAELLTTVGSKLESALLSDFLDAVTPTKAGIRDGIVWIGNASTAIRKIPAKPDPLVAELRSALTSIPTHDLPWRIGWDAARRARSVVGLKPVEPFEFNGLVHVAKAEGRDPGLIALGGETSTGGHALVASQDMSVLTERFAKARALWHFATPHGGRKFLLTSSHSDRQKVERAFAAELLAPAQGVEEFIEERYGVVYSDDIDAVADHFRVSPLVIEHQVENQLELEIAGELA